MDGEQREQLLNRVKELAIESIYLQFTDVSGTMKNITIPPTRLDACLSDGVWFDGSAMEGSARIVESDLYLFPDSSSFAVLPWEPRPTARLICDVRHPDGRPFLADPRGVLKSALAEAAALGFDYRVACEAEFFIFEDIGADTVEGRRLNPVDRSSYFDVPADRARQVSQNTVSALMEMGYSTDTSHHEVAPGQQEVDIGMVDALVAADAMVMLKQAARSYGRRQGLLVSFMPKPLQNVSGSGLHIQQILTDRVSGSNLFFDVLAPYHLSALGAHFVAGQLAHARAMCAVVAPLVNSYKRLVGGAEAPSRVSWAQTHRGALIRIPEVRQNTGIRVELRAPDPSCNPYLALAVTLKAGLDGIANGMRLPEPLERQVRKVEERVDGDVVASPLPDTLAAALRELDLDPVVQGALGQSIYGRFVAAKEREWLAYRSHISSWELESYLRGA